MKSPAAQIYLDAASCLSDEAAEALAGTLLGDDSYDVVVDGDADIYKPDGSLLLRFRKGALPAAAARRAWESLRDAARPSNNRGMAAGEIRSVDEVLEHDSRLPAAVTGSRYRPIKSDGTASSTSYAKAVHSGIVGYFDRYPRIPYCRLTAYNLEDPARFERALPFIRAVNDVFAREVPERHAAQRAMIERTHPDFYIHGTVFTTITVNRNWQTAVHTDRGDLPEGFGVMSVLQAGRYTGGHLIFPQYRVAVDIRSGDVLLADVHEWHGNSPLRGVPGRYERISCVFYYRRKMIECGSAAEELERAKGKPLFNYQPDEE